MLGFATDVGGKTSHTAIMARSLDIPAVVGLQNVSEEMQSGDYVLLDGYNGTVIVNPTDQTLFEYGQLAKIKASLGEKLREIQRQPAVTLDGKTIHLSANIEDQNDIESVILTARKASDCSARNFCSSTVKACPTEEEQYKVYREVAAALKPRPSSSARSISAATSLRRNCSSRARSIRSSAGAPSGSASRSPKCSAPSSAPSSAPAPRAT